MTDQQMKAIDSLVSGTTKTEAAAAAGCDRVTLWRWLTNDANFVAALNDRRNDLYEAGAMRLRNLAGQAIDVLETLLDSDNEGLRLRAAVSILKSVALSDLQQPKGETDPEILEKDWERENLFKKML